MGAGKSRASYLAIGDDVSGMYKINFMNTDIVELFDTTIDYLREAEYELGFGSDPELGERVAKRIEYMLEDAGISYKTTEAFMNLIEQHFIERITDGELSLNDIKQLNKDVMVRVAVSAKVASVLQNEFEKAGYEGVINDFHFLDMSEQMGGVTHTKGEHTTIGVNVKSLKDIDSNGFSAHPVSAVGTISHEMGHALDYFLRRPNDNIEGGAFAIRQFKYKHSKSEPVSIYGATSKDEAFAEASSLYFGGVKDVKVGKEYYDDFKVLMKDLGLQKTFGATKKAFDKNLYK